MPDPPTIIASASTVCQYTDLVFEVDSPESGATYVWTGTAGTASGAGSYIFTVSGATTGTKSKSATARLASSGTTCVSGSAATVSAVVATTPAVPAITRVTPSSAATVCQGTDITYRVTSAVTGATYTWSVTPESPAGTVSTTLGGRSYTVSGAETGTKTVTVYASLASSEMVCPSTMTASLSTVVATMPDTPTIIASASTVCQYTDIVFEVQSPVSGESYTWTGTAGTMSGAGSYIYTVSGATTGTKSKSATARLASSGTTCVSANAATVTAVVATTPAVPAITRVTPSSAATVCQGTDITYRVSSAVTGATYTWSVTPESPAGTVSTTLGGRSYTISGASTGAKTVTVYASLASSEMVCPSTMTASLSTVVATTPDAPTIITSASTVCQNTNVVFEVKTPVSGETYTWTGTSGTASGAGSYLFTVSGSSTGTKSKSATARLTSSGTTCVSASAATVSVEVVATPARPAVTRVTTTPVCRGTDIVFRVTTPVEGLTYTWSGAAGVASGTGNGTFTVSGAEAGTKSVTVTANLPVSETTCQSTASAAVSGVVAIIPDVPTVTLTSASTVCTGNSLSFEATGTAGSTYTWTGSTGTASGAGSYYFRISSSNRGSSSVAAYARLTSSGTTCQSGVSNTVTGYISAPGSQQGPYDPVCGCGTWGRNHWDMVNCDGTCRSTCNILTTCSLTAVSTNQYEGGGKTTHTNAAAICAAKGDGWRLPDRTEAECLCKYYDELPGGWEDSEGYWTSIPWYHDPPDDVQYRYVTTRYGDVCVSGVYRAETDNYYVRCVK
jgi:hypothetical protein